MRRKNEKKQGFLDSKYNRYMVIALEVAGLLTIVIVTCAILKGDILNTFSNEPTKYVLQTQPTEKEEGTRFDFGNYSFSGDTNGKEDIENDLNSVLGNEFQSNLSNEKENAVKLENPTGWSKADIIAKAKSAVNKTQNYKKNVSVHHKESFQATVTDCTGGSVVKTIANTMVGWIVKPVDETLSFKNGRATNSEGESVPLILPNKGGFNLSPKGVSSASARISGNEYVVKLNIVSENVGIYDVPTHNAASIGYLDVGSFDISFMEIDSADISYTGSSIELHINKDGYVTYAVYRVPLKITGSAHRGSISGSATFVGEQSEIWTINY